MKFKTNNYIAPSRIADKYEVTPLTEDDDYMEAMFREVLKDTSPEKPTRAYEEPRKCSETNGVIDRRYGRKTDDDIYQPDLFLGDMSRDPRSLADSADLNGIRKFMEHRQDAYKVNLLNDDDKRVATKTMTHAEVRRAKDQTFDRVKKMYTHLPNQMDQGTRTVLVPSVVSTNLATAGHKSEYTNREAASKSTRQQKQSGNLTDYTIKAVVSKGQAVKRNIQGSYDQRMSSFEVAKIPETIEHTPSGVIALKLSNISDRKRESVEDYKLSADTSESRNQKTKTQHVQAQAERVSEVDAVKTNTLLVANRISRNSDLFNFLKTNPNAMAHKVKLNELLASTKSSVLHSNQSRFEPAMSSKPVRESAMNSVKKTLFLNNDSLVDNMDLDTKYRDEVMVYNYKTRQPERPKQIATRSEAISTYADRVLSSKKSVKNYSQIGLESSEREAIDHADRSANRAAGSSGPIGSKYLRPSMIFPDENRPNDQLTSSRKR